MHTIRNGYFIGGSICYLIIQFLRFQNVQVPVFINSYGTDLLFMPLLFLFSHWLTRIIKRIPDLKFSIGMLFVVFIYISFIFEIYLPQTSKVYVQDDIDVAMYFLGTIGFYFLQKRVA